MDRLPFEFNEINENIIVLKNVRIESCNDIHTHPIYFNIKQIASLSYNFSESSDKTYKYFSLIIDGTEYSMILVSSKEIIMEQYQKLLRKFLRNK